MTFDEGQQITITKSTNSEICNKNKTRDPLRACEKPDFCLTAKLISAVFFFATRIVQFLFFLKPKFLASSLLRLYRPVCVRPGRKHKLLVFSRTVACVLGRLVAAVHFLLSAWVRIKYVSSEEFYCLLHKAHNELRYTFEC